jgi:hypothetical protein
MDFNNSRSYFESTIVAIDTSLFDEATLRSEPKWESFNVSNRGDLRLEGSRGDVGNLKPNKALYLKFNGNFGRAIMCKIKSKT